MLGHLFQPVLDLRSVGRVQPNTSCPLGLQPVTWRADDLLGRAVQMILVAAWVQVELTQQRVKPLRRQPVVRLAVVWECVDHCHPSCSDAIASAAASHCCMCLKVSPLFILRIVFLETMNSAASSFTSDPSLDLSIISIACWSVNFEPLIFPFINVPCFIES